MGRRLSAIEVKHLIGRLADLSPESGGSIRREKPIKSLGLFGPDLAPGPKEMHLNSHATQQMRKSDDPLRGRNDNTVH